MIAKITAVHERVADIPVIIALLSKLRVAELIDKHFPTNGNRTGLSLGQRCVIWLTFIISPADHRLKQVALWVAEHQVTLSRWLGCAVEPRDCSDDRLATGLDYLNVNQYWQAFEADLNGSIIRTYELKTASIRLDTTTAAASVTPDGLFQFGHRKDHRPDLPQLKISFHHHGGRGQCGRRSALSAGDRQGPPEHWAQRFVSHWRLQARIARNPRRDCRAQGLLLVPALSDPGAGGGNGAAPGAGLRRPAAAH